MKIAPLAPLASSPTRAFPTIVRVYFNGFEVDCMITGIVFNDDIFSHSVITLKTVDESHMLEGLYQELLYSDDMPPLKKLLDFFDYPKDHMETVIKNNYVESMKDKYETKENVIIEKKDPESKPLGKDWGHQLLDESNTTHKCYKCEKYVEYKMWKGDTCDKCDGFDIQNYNYCGVCLQRVINPIVRNECGCGLFCRGCAIKHDGYGYNREETCQEFKKTYRAYYSKGIDWCDKNQIYNNDRATRYVGKRIKTEDIKVGMIMIDDWHHDMGTNIEFYKVIRINKKTITVLRVKDELGIEPHYCPSLKKTNGISGEKKISIPTDYFFEYVGKY